MNRKTQATLGGVVLTVIALFLSLLKLICWGRGRAEGTPSVWGTEEGQARREGQPSRRADAPEILSTPPKVLLPVEGTWREKGCTSHFQTP